MESRKGILVIVEGLESLVLTKITQLTQHRTCTKNVYSWQHGNEHTSAHYTHPDCVMMVPEHCCVINSKLFMRNSNLIEAQDLAWYAR